MSTRRLVLLARAGQARDRVQAGLADAGAELVQVFEPGAVEPDALREQSRAAGALLVLLEPAIESALERHEVVFADRAIEVVFDDAEVALRREGWEAARWARHLAAKLAGHDDVLPAGATQESGIVEETTSQPIPVPEWAADGAGSMELVMELAAPAPTTTTEAPAPFESAGAPLTLADADAAPIPATQAVPGLDVVEPRFASAPAWSTLGGDDAAAPDAVQPAEPATPVPAAPAWSTLGSEDEAAPDAAQRAEPAAPVPAAPAWSTVGEDDADASAQSAGSAARAAAAEPVPEAPQWSLSGPDDGDVVTAAATEAQQASDAEFQRELSELEQRVAGMSLSETEGALPGRGAVLVLAGLGGPDALRQLLTALPEDFAKPVLVRQRLDGNHYGKLVRQLQRTTSLQVTLAEAGEAVEAGHVYVLADGIAVQPGARGFSYEATSGVREMLAALRADDSAVVLLSGADHEAVDAAMTMAAHGALVVGQSAEGSFDPGAANELIARGGTPGAPAELARLLCERWSQ